MQNRFYGDARDLMKWGTMFHVTAGDRPSCVLYVPMLNKDDPRVEAATLTGGFPIAPEIHRHFRDARNVTRLPWPPHVTFNYLDMPFTHANRINYFREVQLQVRGMVTGDRVPLIVMFDPDTGVALPALTTKRHVAFSELAEVYRLLRAGDRLAIYQHARRSKDWLEDVCRAVAYHLKIHVDAIQTFKCETVATDAAMLVVEKTGSR